VDDGAKLEEVGHWEHAFEGHIFPRSPPIFALLPGCHELNNSAPLCPPSHGRLKPLVS
jgi:hypothetical protein